MAWKVSNTPTVEKTSGRIVSERYKWFESFYRSRFGSVYSPVVEEIFKAVEHLTDTQIQNAIDAIANGKVKRQYRGDIVAMGDILYASSCLEEEQTFKSPVGCPYCRGGGTLPLIREYYTGRIINPFNNNYKITYYLSIVWADCVCKGNDSSILKLTAPEEVLNEFIDKNDPTIRRGK